MLGASAMSELPMADFPLTVLIIGLLQRAVWVGFKSAPFKSIGGSLRRIRQ